MRAELKHLDSPDVQDLRAFRPNDPTNFCVFVEAMVGPEAEEASESFDLHVCTPAWIAEEVERLGPMMGRHYIIVTTFDYQQLFNWIADFCSRCEGQDWPEIGAKVGHLGHWEFEDYREYSPRP